MMRRFLAPVVVCLSILFAAPPAQAGWRDVVSPSKNWHRIKYCCWAAKEKVVTYCSNKVEKAKADQEKMWGLHVPTTLDARRPLVVCIHGLDSSPGVFGALMPLLESQGLQVGYFAYPSDGPIRGSAARLANSMDALRKAYPGLKVHVVGHSMGTLVARAYIEGERFSPGDVDRFIAVAPPNHGSPWTRHRYVLEFNEQYWLWRTNADWSPIWMFTDGHGEAADDLKPDSAFLKSLNAGPRRAGVRYTIIQGDHHVLDRFYANGLDGIEYCIPKRHWWGIRQTVACIESTEKGLLAKVSDTDGVVPLSSALLDGVTDVVRLHGDHNTLVMSAGGQPPVAWETIRARLVE